MNRITRNINNTATNQWKNDCMASVDYYNTWFINFAPPSFRVAREESIRKVKTAFQFTKNALLLDADTLLVHPEVLAVARQMTCPPLARDRLCGALADPILRNAQEKRQLKALSDWLSKHGYTQTTLLSHRDLNPGQYAIHVNMPCRLTEYSANTVNVSVDMIILSKSATHEDLPILIEAKSAGDFTNVNKRRKEEARKMEQLRKQYGEDVRYLLFLCGYFDAQYLGYEASEGIDWIWEHRISDMEGLGL